MSGSKTEARIHPILLQQYFEWTGLTQEQLRLRGGCDRALRRYQRYQKGEQKRWKPDTLENIAKAMSSDQVMLEAKDLLFDEAAVAKFIIHVYQRCGPTGDVDRAATELRPHLTEDAKWTSERDADNQLTFGGTHPTHLYLSELFRQIRLDCVTDLTVSGHGDNRAVATGRINICKHGTNEPIAVDFSNTFEFNDEMKLLTYRNVFNPTPVVTGLRAFG